MAEISGAFEVDGFVKQRKELESLLMSNPAMEKKVQGIIRKVLIDVRKAMMQAAKQPSVVKSDPRKAYKAVKTMVYKRILGGNVNILNKRKAGAATDYRKPTTLKPGQRGGNRRTRSSRTKRLEGYQGSDRGFILRFLNAGVSNRVIKFTPDEARENVHRGSRGGNIQKYGKTINTGWRGGIAARNWFGSRSHAEMERAAANLERMIDELIKQELR